jgi:hypothetical protein
MLEEGLVHKLRLEVYRKLKTGSGKSARNVKGSLPEKREVSLTSDLAMGSSH